MSSVDVDLDSHRQSAKDAWSVFFKTRFDPGPAARVGRAARLPQLKAELEVMQEYLALAKQNINKCSSVACRLPAEVLVMIFSSAREVWPPEYGGMPHSRDLGWIYVTHVCTEWRKAALGAHTLWQEVDCIALPSSMATTILTRSGQLPLQLYVDTYLGTAVSDIINVWLSWPALRRASLLHIEDDYDAISGHEVGLWYPVLKNCMPALRDLSLAFVLDNRPETLPANLFAGAQPALTSLHLRNCTFSDWNTPIFGGAMTTLSFENDFIYEEYPSLPTATELKNVFARLTSLRHLSLKDFYVKKEPTPPGPFTFYTTLSSLTFRFYDQGLYQSHYSAFWNQFIVPVTATLKIWAQADAAEWDGELEGLVEPVVRTVNATYPAKELVVDALEVTLWCTVRPSAMLRTPEQQLDVNAEPEVVGRTIECTNSIAKYYVERLPLESLVSISITRVATASFNAPGVGWLSKLGQARNVRRVAVYFTSCQSLLEDLLKKDMNDGSFALFPLLDTLILHHGATFTGITDSQTSLDLVLLEFLAARRGHGAPLTELMVDSRMKSLFIWSQIDKQPTKLTFFEI